MDWSFLHPAVEYKFLHPELLYTDNILVCLNQTQPHSGLLTFRRTGLLFCNCGHLVHRYSGYVLMHSLGVQFAHPLVLHILLSGALKAEHHAKNVYRCVPRNIAQGALEHLWVLSVSSSRSRI